MINIVTIFLGLAVGSKLQADEFLAWSTLSILLLGIVAFAIGTATGVLMGKAMNKLSQHAHQSADRRGRRVGRADGSPGRQSGGS